MTRLKILGATAILASALTAPAMAQQVIYNPGYCAQFYPNANCQNKGPGNPYTGDYQRQAGYGQDGTYGRTSYDRTYDRNARRGYYERRAAERDHRFWPGDVAAGVVGGAIGTAGAIATAPFRNDSYAYYNNGYYNGQTYAQRNGFVCTPGTWFKGDDGRQHLCQ